MGLLTLFKRQRVTDDDTTARSSYEHSKQAPLRNGSNDRALGRANAEPIRILRLRIVAMGLVVSLGGLIFGFDTGQISGFLEMPDFLSRFADSTNEQGELAFSNVRSGTIVALLSIGTLIGALLAAPVADYFGRKIAIIVGCIVFIIGNIVQITTPGQIWYQIAIGRLVAGLGVGCLSVLTPMYQSETAPRQIRGALVSCYQLFITFGIFLANCVNFATEQTYSNSAEWRIPMGIGFVFPVIMAVGILFLRESPRWDYRKGRVDAANVTISKSYGVPDSHWEVRRELREIKEKLEAENAGGKAPWHGVFTGPRMAYRTLLGMSLQALQQLTGANFFFYYGTTIFRATGLDNSYVTAMILGGINFGTTFLALYIIEKFGRRKCLITGGTWMGIMFLCFASVGHFALDQTTPQNTPQAGTAMIVLAALFIVGFASTWGPLIWAVVAELYPSRYRARALGLATASNWSWNFLISFFTPFITAKIDYRYGYVFASCCFLGAVVTYFFVCESQGRTLEEIDTMYVAGVKPWRSSEWVAPTHADDDGEDGATASGVDRTKHGGRSGSDGSGVGVDRVERVDV